MRRSLAPIFALLITFSLCGQEQSSEGITADQLWAALLNGNQQFKAGKITYDRLVEERGLIARSQTPPVTVLACADSRVPPELAFNQSLGALLVVRSAGNVADEFGVASMEFAIARGFTKLIVVLGHEHCDVVVAALGVGDPSTPALRTLAERIRSSFAGIPYDSRDPTNVRKATDANTRAAAANLLAQSALIREAVTSGRVKVVPAFYELGTGEVRKVE